LRRDTAFFTLSNNTHGSLLQRANPSLHPNVVKGEVMTQYLVAIYQPDDYEPSVAEGEAMSPTLKFHHD
jgi:hypothetical protein